MDKKNIENKYRSRRAPKIYRKKPDNFQVVLQDNVVYLYNYTKGKMEEIKHEEKYVVNQAIVFRGVLYTCCTFEVETYTERYEEKYVEDYEEICVVFMWKDGIPVQIFDERRVHIFTCENSLFIAGLHFFNNDLHARIYTFKNGELTHEDNLISVNTDIVFDCSGKNVYVYCDGCVYTVKNKQYVKQGEVELDDFCTFFCRDKIFVLPGLDFKVYNSWILSDKKFANLRNLQMKGLSDCGKYAVFSMFQDTSIVNLENDTELILDGEWTVSDNFLCRVVDGEINSIPFHNLLYHLLPNPNPLTNTVSGLTNCLNSGLFDRHLLVLISKFSSF